MTMSELREMRKTYPSLNLELKRLQQKKTELIKENTVTDTVVGSSAEYPYTSHPVSVEGFMQTTAVRKQLDSINEQINKIIDMQNKVDKVISSISDNLVRYSVMQYVVEQKTWVIIYSSLDTYCEGATVDALKKRIAREIKKI
jgi:hypothetical protein